MKNIFASSLNTLQQIHNRFDAETGLLKTTLLKSLSVQALPSGQQLLQYHDLLLFLCAYPNQASSHRLAEKELKRIAAHLKKKTFSKKDIPENEGLPFTNTITRFSPEFLHWLHEHKDLEVKFDSFYEATLSMNDVLNITLPSLLKAETTAGLDNEDLLKVLHIQPQQYVPFWLGQLEQLKEWPLLQELFTERTSMYVKLVPKNALFSRAFNRIDIKQVYHHHDLLKQFDRDQLLNAPLPALQLPLGAERQQMLKAIKNAMALMVREIDPATFLQEETMRMYDLERGIRIAVYSMYPQRQLPLETYFGFTFFKNGIPVSYGGVWVFGKLARIGLNIFEPFRGGESGYILCQLIRVFKQALGVSYVEIEPYQFGLDNPGGISSGAFWFYYKYGFRPVDSQLKQLAETEYRKIKSRKNYRSSEKTLLRFTESNIGLNLGKTVPLDVLAVTAKVLTLIKKDWQHNYCAAKQQAVNEFCKKVQLDTTALGRIEKNTLEELSLWAMAMKVNKSRQLQLMKQMVLAKTKDDYAYQQLLLEFFEQ